MENHVNGSMDREAVNRLVTQWIDMWNGDISIATHIISPNNRVHAAMFDGGDGSAVGGVAGMVSLVSQLRSFLPDLIFSIEVGPIIDGDHVVIRWIARGHYGGGIPNAGAPVGAPVTFHGTDILRTTDGLIGEYWLNADSLHLMTQLQVGTG